MRIKLLFKEKFLNNNIAYHRTITNIDRMCMKTVAIRILECVCAGFFYNTFILDIVT